MILLPRDDKGRPQDIMAAYEHILTKQTFRATNRIFETSTPNRSCILRRNASNTLLAVVSLAQPLDEVQDFGVVGKAFDHAVGRTDVRRDVFVVVHRTEKLSNVCSFAW